MIDIGAEFQSFLQSPMKLFLAQYDMLLNTKMPFDLDLDPLSGSFGSEDLSVPSLPSYQLSYNALVDFIIYVTLETFSLYKLCKLRGKT